MLADKVQFYEDLCAEATQASRNNNTRAVYQVVRKLSGKSSKNTSSLVKKRDGTEAESKDELLKEWRSYFEELLNNRSTNTTGNDQITPVEVDLPINCSDFTLQELKAALSKLSLGKSPGADQSVTPEALKYGGESMTKALLDVCNKVLNDL